MQNLEREWTFYDKQALPPYARRRKPVGRRVVHQTEWQSLAQTHAKVSAEKLLEHVAGALSWLCDKDSPLARPLWEAWQLYETQNGGIYLMPLEEGPWRMTRSDRNFDETMSRDGAGLCASMLGIWYFSRAPIFFMEPSRARLLRRLAHYRDVHPEGREVRAVLD